MTVLSMKLKKSYVEQINVIIVSSRAFVSQVQVSCSIFQGPKMKDNRKQQLKLHCLQTTGSWFNLPRIFISELKEGVNNATLMIFTDDNSLETVSLTPLLTVKSQQGDRIAQKYWQTVKVEKIFSFRQEREQQFENEE